MNTYADKTEKKKNQSVLNGDSQLKRGSESTYQFVDIRPEAVAQRKLQEMGNISPQVWQLRAVQEMANNSPQVKRMAQLQAIANNHSAQQHQTIQKKENNTGLPDALKSGMENLSGISLDDVKVHRNSDKPAQLQAHAYAQGTDIHLASGQEKHLPHEAWHVVQQKQGRVKPTMQMKGMVNVNDDAGLEKEADVMGAKAQGISLLTISEKELETTASSSNLIQGMFSVNTKVYQFGGEGASKWIPAAVALGAGLFLVYRAQGSKKGEISAEEAQKYGHVSAENVEQHSERLDAIPSSEKDLGAKQSHAVNSGQGQPHGSSEQLGISDPTGSSGEPEQRSKEKPGESSSEPVKSQSGSVPSGTSYQNGSSGAPEHGKTKEQEKKKVNLEFGEGPGFLQPVIPIPKNQAFGITPIYKEPEVNPTEGGIGVDVVGPKVGARIQTTDTLTEVQATMGSASINLDENSGKLKASAGLGEAKGTFSGQNVRANASATGPKGSISVDARGVSLEGDAGEASAELAGTIPYKKWRATIGGTAKVTGPSMKDGKNGKEFTGPEAEATIGIGIARENLVKELVTLASIRKQVNGLPTVSINIDGIVEIVKKEPEVVVEAMQEFGKALEITMADELNIDPSFLQSVQVDKSEGIKETSIIGNIKSWFFGDSPSKTGNKIPSEVDRSSESYSSESTRDSSESTPDSPEPEPTVDLPENVVKEKVTNAIEEANEDIREAKENILRDHFFESSGF